MSLPDPSTLIGRGESAEVFRLDADTVLKLFNAGMPDHHAERECRAATIACDAGLPVARPLGIARVGARVGVRMDYLPGALLLWRSSRNPIRMILALRALGRWQADMHRVQVAAGQLPPLNDVLRFRIAASVADEEAKAAALAALAALPAGTCLCHGDFHLGNLLGTPNRLWAVDWSKATVGTAAADAARSQLLIRYGRYGRFMRRFAPARLLRHASAEIYLAFYCRSSGETRAAIDAWTFPIAVAWLQPGGAFYRPALLRAIAAMKERSGSIPSGTA